MKIKKFENMDFVEDWEEEEFDLNDNRSKYVSWKGKIEDGIYILKNISDKGIVIFKDYLCGGSSYINNFEQLTDDEIKLMKFGLYDITIFDKPYGEDRVIKYRDLIKEYPELEIKK